MTKHRFFVSPNNIEHGQINFSTDLQSQIGRVLRLKEGEEVEVLDNQGCSYLVHLVQSPEGVMFGKVIYSRKVDPDPGINLTLFFGLSQREKVEMILQKGTEIGLSGFQPYISRRTLPQQPDSVEKHRKRWEAIMREAAEQSGGSRIPILHPAVKLKDAINAAVEARNLIIAAWEDETENVLKTVLGTQKQASIALFCGPEGGFDPVEIGLMRTSGIKFFSLGKRILRMETAAILAPALVLYELGEMAVSE